MHLFASHHQQADEKPLKNAFQLMMNNSSSKMVVKPDLIAESSTD